MPDMADPIGIRNSNPGNIRTSGISWEGAVGAEGGFVKFDGPVSGGKALIRNLMAYNTKHGLNTVEGLINRWAPPVENNTSSYVNVVATALGVNPKDALDMRSPVVLGKLATAIAKHENGRDFDPEFFQGVASNVVAGTPVDPLRKAYAESMGKPEFTKAMTRAEALSQHSPVELSNDSTVFDQRFPETVEGPNVYAEDAQALANTTLRAGFSESLLDSMVNNTVTAKLFEMWQQGAPDPNFDPMSEENRKKVQALGLYGNDAAMDYISGARNAEDYGARLKLTQERLEFQRRMQNTEGLQFAGVMAGQLMGGLADPVALVSTMGLGATVASVRSAAAAGRALSIARGAGWAAAENIAVGQVLEKADNQRFSWGTLMEQGVMGAGLGALGGLMVHPNGHLLTDPNTVVDPGNLPMLTGAHQAVQEVMDGTLNRATERGQFQIGELAGNYKDDSVPTSIDELQLDQVVINAPTAAPVRSTVDAVESPEAKAQATISEALAQVREESSRTLTRPEMSSRIGYDPVPTIDNPRYRDLHDAGIVTELRSADDLAKVSSYQRNYGEAIPDDAKAVYMPQDDRVYVFRDRLTADELKDPSGLVMHEVGVHYGLERAVGTEQYNRILSDLEKSSDPRVREAFAKVPGDTPEHLKLEEALGYLVENHLTIGVVKQFIANLRNWLRDNVRAFRGMEVSVNDAIAYVNGSVEHVRREGRLSADLTYPYVWHGSAVKGIDNLDIAYAGSGEGNAAYGFGHYVTSEKGTAVDYRNKESLRRGLKREDGGLYRLRVNSDREALISWDYALTPEQADTFRSLGVAEDRLSGTGGDAYHALTEALGSQRAASKALHDAGVPGLRYQTGRSRGQENPNSNYVLFDNSGLSMEARYSRTGTQVQEPRTTREQMIEDALNAVGEQPDPAAASTIERGQKWLAARPEWMKAGDSWAMSPGTVLSASKSKVARIAGSILFENALGSGKRNSTVAMAYEMLQRGYRDPFIMAVQDDMVKLMSTKEKLDYMFWSGSRKAVQRISTQVAEERLRHREAVKAKKEYVSNAPPEIQRIAREMDNQIDKMTKDGLGVGNEYAEHVRGLGWVGFMPQVWKWDMLGDLLRNDPAKWGAIRKNFTHQYTEMNVDPIINQMIADGIDQSAVMAVRARLMDQVQHQVDTRMAESIRDPDTRTNQDTNKFESMAAELLEENWNGQQVTGNVVTEFRRLLAEKVKDRSRTEFDLMREVEGVRLLDYIEHDVMSTIQHTAHRFAGQNAMAKAGFRTPSDFEALITLASKDGATPQEVELLAFGGRAFGFRPMIAQDHPMLATVKNFTYAATMGKLGIANLADVAAVITSTGVRGMFKTLGYSFRGNTELVNLLSKRGMGLIGQDYRIHNATADVLPNGRSLTGTGMGLHRVSVKAAQLVSYINGSNFLQKMLHKGFLPVMAEDLTTAIRGGDGGMSVKRLADAGLDGPTVARIRDQLEKYEAGRKEGDGFKWAEWDDQNAADKFIEAMHRVTYQTFQRGLVGEAAAWRSESAMGALIGQFHNFGLTSMEKQLGRNLAINDINTYTALAVGMAWSAALYHARLEANTWGMADSKAKEYKEENTTPWKLSQGILTYFNMSGIGAEIFGMGEVVFGGNTYQGGSGPVASMGYLGNLNKAANSLGSIVMGQSEFGRDARNILRILPGGNSIIGTYYSNVLRDH